MASAFDGLSSFDINWIQARLMAGESMASIRRAYGSGLSAKRLREMREEFFEPLIANPDKVKELAVGPLINPLGLNHPKRVIDRFTRMSRAASKPVQIEMFAS